jgi:DNA-binding Xre family transcriptional regulator
VTPQTPSTGYRWRLRQVMAGRELWKATDLGPLLAERGVVLSSAQLYRLVAKAPERLSLPTLAALCDIFSCTPNDLIELAPVAPPRPDPPSSTRPRRARVATR